MLNAFFYNLVPAYFDEIREQKQINARYRRKRILEATLAMHTYVPKLPLFTYYCNARGFVLINKLSIYLFYNFCHNKANILYYIISYYMLHPIIYNTCYSYYILKYSMFTFVFPPFSPFVCQTRPDMETTKIP